MLVQGKMTDGPTKSKPELGLMPAIIFDRLVCELIGAVFNLWIGEGGYRYEVSGKNPRRPGGYGFGIASSGL